VEESRKKYFLDLLITIVGTLQAVRLNVYFILISKSSPYVLSYRSIYSWVNTVGYFSNVLIEILVTNGWKQSFAKLPIPKLSLHNNAVFYLWQKASQRFAWKSHFLTLYTPASLNYRLSVSENVTTNVTAKPVTFLRGTNDSQRQTFENAIVRSWFAAFDNRFRHILRFHSL